MSREYETREELRNEIEWEGGIEEFILEHGTNLSDLPEGDDELETAFAYLLDAKKDFARACRKVSNLLDLDY